MSNLLHDSHLSTAASRASWWQTAVMRAMRRQYERIRHRRQAHRDLARLMELDDRALADIGVAREELMQVTGYGRRPDDTGRHRYR